MKKYLTRAISCLTVAFFMIRHLLTKVPAYTGSLKKTHRWYRLKVPEAKSSDGSPYYVYFKKGKVNKLVVYFSGGGGSWCEETARPVSLIRSMILGEVGYYFPRADSFLEILFTGIMAKNDPRNPFNDWNYIYLPYSTADFHVGNNEFPYTGKDGARHILYHNGVENVHRSLELAPPEFRKPEALLVAGESAGAFGSVANADTVAGFFPECMDITVYSDGSHIEYPHWQEVIRDVWKAAKDKYACVQEDGMLIRDWFIRLHEKLGSRVALLHSNSAFDETLSQYQHKLNHDQYTLTPQALEEFHRGLALETRQIKAMVPNYYYYIASHNKDPATGKTGHTTSRWPPRFYDDQIDGVSVAEWLRAAVLDKQYRDVGSELLDQDAAPVAAPQEKG